MDTLGPIRATKQPNIEGDARLVQGHPQARGHNGQPGSIDVVVVICATQEGQSFSLRSYDNEADNNRLLRG